VAKTSRELPGPPLSAEADARSRRRARKWWWATAIVVVGLVVWVLTSGGESQGNKVTAPRPFCNAAQRYETAAERQNADGKLTPAEVARQVELVQTIVDTAPRKVHADAETFLAALREAETAPAGEKVHVDSSVQGAIRNVNREFAQGCAVYARDGGI